jgi:hypothetical protein
MALLRRCFALAILVLTLSTGSGNHVWAAEQKVGEVVQAAPRVEGRSGGAPPQSMDKKGARVEKGMTVNTSRKASAQIAIDTDSKVKRGTVLLGPNTEVVFTDFVVDRARGIPTKMSWLVQLGQFRVALLPGGTAPGEGEYWIQTPTGTIRMAGTDVYVNVPHPWVTYVYVIEGEVTVEARNGRTVQVRAGQWTTIPRGGPPADPTNVPPGGGWLPVDPRKPDEWLLPDPPNFDGGRFQLDLPKSSRP